MKKLSVNQAAAVNGGSLLAATLVFELIRMTLPVPRLPILWR